MPHLQSHTLSREWLRLLTSLTDHRRQRTLVCPIIVSLIRFPSCCSTVLDSTPTKSLCVKKISVSGRPGPGARCTTKCGRWPAGWRVIGNIKPLFTRAHLPAPPGAPPTAPALRSQRRPLDGGGWPCGLVLGDGQPARLGLLGLGGWGCSGGTAASGRNQTR